MKTLITLALLFTFSAPAFARDSSHLVCSGFMAAKPDPDNYGISVQFDEGRSDDGSSRLETLSSVWQGSLFQGSRVNSKDGFGENGTITMAAKDDAKKIFYKGKYSLVAAGKGYKLSLKGLLNVDPSDASSPETISTTLPCVDISN
jgi:hypothetical protein